MADSLAQAKYAALTFNSPLSQPHADELINHLDLSPETSVVDLGCGWGELLIQIASKTGANCTGVDTDEACLQRGRDLAETQGVRAAFINKSAEQYTEQSDRAICIGSSHASGGSEAMFKHLAEIVPKGKVLVGDMCWERPPTEAALGIFGDEVPMLVDLVKMARDAGWKVLHLTTSDQREWDDFESRHRAGLRRWLIENPESDKAKEVEEQQNGREMDYLTGYRGVLGFVWLVLAR